MHFQYPINNWTNALVRMPDYALLKSVNDGGLLIDGLRHWTAAGRSADKLFLDFRHHDFQYPNWTQAVNWTHEDFKELWRANFFRFINRTYLEQYSAHIKFIEELNEYTDSRMITDKALLAPRIASARAAVDVWNNEFRGKNVIAPDGGSGIIPSDARLVICNSPVGNDVPVEYFRLCRDEDAVLGVHTYTKWTNKQRVQSDFRWHSGRPFHNEQSYGIKVDYILSECGPYNGSTDGGWRHSSCLDADLNFLVYAMREWTRDLKTTAAYAEGRIMGQGAWFTSTNSGWDYYQLFERELLALAAMSAEEWNPTEPPEPPEPPPPDTGCRGLPRVQYNRVYNVIHQSVPEEEAVEIFRLRWRAARETVGGSFDDAGVGDLNQKLARIYGLIDAQHQEYRNWFNTHYPGTFVEFADAPPILAWPLPDRAQQTAFEDWAQFDAPRDYAGNHEGIDLRCNLGERVVAARAGTVVWASDKKRNSNEDSKLGKHIIIDHRGGLFTWYGHLSDMLSAVGDVVERGDTIGFAGMTGNATDVHLHFIVQRIGHGLSGYVVSDVVDPRPLLGL